MNIMRKYELSYFFKFTRKGHLKHFFQFQFDKSKSNKTNNSVQI